MRPVEKQRGAYMVTGASSGIGRALCQRLLDDGYEVFGIARFLRQDPIKHPLFTAVSADLADLTAVDQTIKRILKSIDMLEGLVLCAGAGLFGQLEQLNEQAIRRLLDLNLASPILSARACVPTLKRQKYGLIVLLGSEAALQGSQQGTIYCATKFGLRGFAQALSKECARSGVRVTLVNPGMVNTEFYDELSFRPDDDSANAIETKTIVDTILGIINSAEGTVFDEVNLSPRKLGIHFKK